MKRPTWPPRGPRIFPAWRTETIDGRTSTSRASPKPYPPGAARAVAGASRMVRRRGVRALPGFARHTRNAVAAPDARRILRGAGQSPLLSAEPLLLKYLIPFPPRDY